jgi:hypothetical protein
MRTEKNQLLGLFTTLDQKIREANRDRKADGRPQLAKAKIQLLGQMSLMSNDRVTAILSLVQTGDFDAFLRMETAVKHELEKLLASLGLIYDEDSYLIWVPPRSRFEAPPATQNPPVVAT